jgi:hypothetical protein
LKAIFGPPDKPNSIFESMILKPTIYSSLHKHTRLSNSRI